MLFLMSSLALPIDISCKIFQMHGQISFLRVCTQPQDWKINFAHQPFAFEFIYRETEKISAHAFDWYNCLPIVLGHQK